MPNFPFEKMLGSLPVGVMLIDKNYKVQYWNQWLEMKTEISAESMVGTTLEEKFSGKSLDRFNWAVERTIIDKYPQVLSQALNHFVVPIEVEYGIEHGLSYMQQHIEISPVQAGSEVYAQVVIFDVTETVIRSSALVSIAHSGIQSEEIDGAYHHMYLWEWLKTQFSLAQRQLYPISCLVLSLDQSKELSDGREISLALSQTVSVMDEILRQSDVVISYPQNRLVALLPCCVEEDALMVASRICEQVSKSKIQNNEAGLVTCSVGVSTWTPENPCTSEELLKKTDRMLFKAQSMGGDQAVSGLRKTA